jgi:hypothetical protein
MEYDKLLAVLALNCDPLDSSLPRSKVFAWIADMSHFHVLDFRKISRTPMTLTFLLIPILGKQRSLDPQIRNPQLQQNPLEHELVETLKLLFVQYIYIYIYIYIYGPDFLSFHLPEPLSQYPR